MFIRLTIHCSWMVGSDGNDWPKTVVSTTTLGACLTPPQNSFGFAARSLDMFTMHYNILIFCIFMKIN